MYGEIFENPPGIGRDNIGHFFHSSRNLFRWAALSSHQKYLELSGRAIVWLSEENLARFRDSDIGVIVFGVFVKRHPTWFFLLVYQYFTWHSTPEQHPCAPTNYHLVLDPVHPKDHELKVREPFQDPGKHLLKKPSHFEWKRRKNCEWCPLSL